MRNGNNAEMSIEKQASGSAGPGSAGENTCPFVKIRS